VKALFNLQKDVRRFDVEPSRSRLSLKLSTTLILAAQHGQQWAAEDQPPRYIAIREMAKPL
jgi:hypothetical protein